MQHFYFNDSFGEQWFDYQDLYRMFVNTAPNKAHFVEVGSWKGRSASFLGVEIINSNKNIKVDCIDTWIGSLDKNEISKTIEYQNDPYIKADALLKLFLENTKPVSNIINAVKKPSTEAALDYKNCSLDVVFIDACHTYNCVCEDIAAWLPKVKIGGLIAGHDIHSPDVERAVKNSLPRFDVSGSCWVYKKTNE